MTSEALEREAFFTQWFSDWTRQPNKREIFLADKAFKKQQLTNKKNSMNVQGNIRLIQEAQTFSSGFTKRTIVITTNDMYPQDIAIDFVKEGVTMLDLFNPGQNVSIDFNLRGNEHNGKFYVSLQGWRISEVTTATNSDLPG